MIYDKSGIISMRTLDFVCENFRGYYLRLRGTQYWCRKIYVHDDHLGVREVETSPLLPWFTEKTDPLVTVLLLAHCNRDVQVKRRLRQTGDFGVIFSYSYSVITMLLFVDFSRSQNPVVYK